MTKSIIYLTGAQEAEKSELLKGLGVTQECIIFDPIVTERDSEMVLKTLEHVFNSIGVVSAVFTEQKRHAKTMHELRKTAKGLSIPFYSMELEDLSRFEKN